jgi:hypothetical protein
VTTLQDWIKQTRDHVEGNISPEANVLQNPYTAGETEVTLRYSLDGVFDGAILSAGFTDWRVWAVASLTKSATVSVWGGTDVNHAAGEVVRVNPRLTDTAILTAINNELDALTSPDFGLYQVRTTPFTHDGSRVAYDFPTTDFLDVIEVRYDEPGPARAWPKVETGKWRLIRSADLTDFPSGLGLRVDTAYAGNGIRATYKSKLTRCTTATTDVSVTGLQSTAEDIPPLGAAVRIMAGREIARNDIHSQPGSRRLEEVTPGAVAKSISNLVALRADRINQEAARLRREHPVAR